MIASFVECQTRVGPLPSFGRHSIGIMHTLGNIRAKGAFTTYDQGFIKMKRQVDYNSTVQSNSYGPTFSEHCYMSMVNDDCLSAMVGVGN
jgi:hypothetical protein